MQQTAAATTAAAATLDEFPLEFAFSAGMTLSIFQAIDAAKVFHEKQLTDVAKNVARSSTKAKTLRHSQHGKIK